MNKYGQQSIWDSLIRIMPEVKNKAERSPDHIDPIAAKSLYNIWRTGSKNEENKVFKKPVTLSKDDVERMKNDGLIIAIGDNIKVTDKGSKVIRVMILGDDRSVFEDNGIPIDYHKALNSAKGVKTAKRHRIASSWWARF